MAQSKDKFLLTISKAFDTFYKEQLSESIKRGLAFKKARQNREKVNSYNVK